MSTIQSYSRSPYFEQITKWFTVFGLAVTGIGLLDEFFLELDPGLNIGGWGMVFLTSGLLLWGAMRAQKMNRSDGLVMGLISWGLFAPITIGFQAITLVSFGQVNQIIPTGGALTTGPLSFGPWWFYFWMGLSVAITAYFMTQARLPKWPPRRFIVWPWFTGFFVAFFWPTRLMTSYLEYDIGDWTLSTMWTGVFEEYLAGLMGYGVDFSFEAISFGEYWGAFFLYIWLLLGFTVWTVFVYGRRLRVGKENYNNGEI